MKLVFLPTGRFLMGHPKMADPVHSVTISGFWMGQHEVTNRQFEQFRKRPRPVESPKDDHPVTRVSWNEATAFCRWLSRREPGSRYRLPTEAEWEYAARGGLEQKEYPWGNDPNWRGKANLGTLKATSVGSFPPNSYGLYDMTGNVSEWVSDWYSEDYYRQSPPQNPTGPKRPNQRHIQRGGSCLVLEGPCWVREQWIEESDGKPVYHKFRDLEQADGSGFRVALAAPVTWNSTKTRGMR